MRNKAIDSCKKEKRRYLEQTQDRNRKDSKQLWKTLKEILKGNKNGVEYKEIQCGNKLISNPEEIAEEFNSYLVDSVRQLRSKFIDKYIEKVKFAESKFDEFKEINEENLYSIVRKLANKGYGRRDNCRNNENSGTSGRG